MNALTLIDTHAHLEQVDNVAQALETARVSGVIAVVAVGMDLSSNRRILELTEAHPNFVFPALGIHPWAIDASEKDETVRFIASNIDACVAVGEIGLDYWIKQDKELQREVFGELLEMARAHNKPISTHSRGSYEDVFNMVKQSGVARAVFHWYSGPAEITQKIVESGYCISATPAVEYSEKHREVIESVPLENLLLETDSPVKYKGIVSEPASVRITLQEVANLKQQELDIVAKITTENAARLFGLEGIY